MQDASKQMQGVSNRNARCRQRQSKA